jgi:hypothetical protein
MPMSLNPRAIDSGATAVSQAEHVRKALDTLLVWANQQLEEGENGQTLEKGLTATLVSETGMDPDSARAAVRNILQPFHTLVESLSTGARSAAVFGNRMTSSWIEPIQEAQARRSRGGGGLKVN